MSYHGLKILAVIPARGGSKRVPRKNIRQLGGRPLIAYTIDAARGASRLTECVVSTDDDEIAQIARQCGGNVPFARPAELAGDDVPDRAVLEHAVQSGWRGVAHRQDRSRARALHCG